MLAQLKMKKGKTRQNKQGKNIKDFSHGAGLITANENHINDILTVIFIIRLFHTSNFRVPKGRIMF